MIADFCVLRSQPKRPNKAIFKRITLAGIVVVAFAARSIWLIRPGFHWAIGTDSGLYLALAAGLQHGCGFSPWNGSCASPELMRTPGYPAFLLVFWGHVRGVILAQAAIGALVCLLVGIFVGKRKGVGGAAIAATLVALDIPIILETKEIMTEALFQGLATYAVFASLEERGVTSGITLALSILVRPVGLVLVPVVAIGSIVRRRWQSALAVTAMPLLLVFTWTLRNYRVAGIFTFSDEGVFNLYSYTAPAVLALDAARPISTVREELDKASTPFSSFDPKAQQEQNLGGVPITPALWRFMIEKCISVMMRHPIDLAFVTLDGFCRLAFTPYVLQTPWQGFVPYRRAFRVMRSVSTGLQVSALVVLWIGTVFASVRAKHLDQWILLSSALVLILAASPYFDGINMRYRSAAIPFLAALAGLGWGELLPSTGENEHPPEVRPTEPVN